MYLLFINIPGAWIPSIATFREAHQAFHLVLEFLAADPSSQTIGISVLVDDQGLSMSKLLSINIGLLKQSAEFMLVSSNI
ncbi:hypothetical protein IscW_ISCW011970 [Ixodes scapularis]|uniref:Uncharacterized protein n=1 Tax=Ixodes scapularis TaxID=6945 RepID=B7QDT0_IXOSC|nr:hypothetical protein IscW_ISCW011970 [Ixodes scapularis]|eukprot:XP_002413694.1 hypothetical protein IscW_ISCW011970 [Ixodes scapularis]